jgi:GT2 family glycosyltransferase
LGADRHPPLSEQRSRFGGAPDEPPARVAVVVLAHNGLADTLGCIDSLSQASWEALSVIVVDNGSSDGTAEVVRNRFPDVTVIARSENAGFAEGNNIGIRQALESGVDYVFLANNDTRLAPDAIAECVRVATLNADAAAICPLVYFADPDTLVWYAGATFDPRRACSGRMVGYREIDRGQFDGERETDRITGAASLMPRAALEDVGLLDSELFFLYEDVDWSLRARRAGHRVYVAPRARVWHRVSATAGGEHSPFIAYYDTRNHLIVCNRHAPLRGPRRLARELGVLGVHLAGARRSKQRLAYLAAACRGWLDARRGRLGQRS